MENRFDVIVIGAGHNGLTVANQLAQKKKKVLVIEKNSEVGGLARKREFHLGFFSNGLLHDTTMLNRELVKNLGLENFGFKYNEKALKFYTPVSSKSSDAQNWLGVSHDSEVGADEIRKISAADAKKYKEFRAFIQRISGPIKMFLQTVPPKFEKMTLQEKFSLLKTSVALRLLGKKDMLEVLRIPPMCVADWLGEWFVTEELKSNLALTALSGTQTGPWSPGTAMNLLFKEVQRTNGIVGGPAVLISSLSRAAQEFGAVILKEKTVSKVTIDNGAVTGVELATGEKIFAPVVVSSCDPKTTFNKLVEAQFLLPSFEAKIKNYRSKGTLAQMNLAIKGSFEPLNAPASGESAPSFYRIVDTIDNFERAFDACKYGEASSSPALEICVNSSVGKDMSPTGSTSVSILVHFVPYTTAEKNAAVRSQVAEAVMKILKSKFKPFEVLASEVLTPFDLEKEYSITGGQITHGEHAIDQMIVRPVPECSRFETPIDGLFLCGSGSFPGGNLTCLPGYLAAQVIH